MHIRTATLATCSTATGVAVAIDVIRAYTTAAFGLAAGAGRILLAGSVAEAFALRERFPGALVMGEVDGLQPAGFDFGNSPAALDGLDLSGRTLIHRTSAGTQGPVRAVNAATLFGAAFVVASATARAVAALAPDQVTLIATGAGPDDRADEDLALAEYLAAALTGPAPNPGPYLERALRSEAAQKFLDPARLEFPLADLERCLQLDRFDFPLQVAREDDLLVIRNRR